MKYICITCDQEFPDGIPEGAVQITPGEHRVNSYRIDGTVHHLRKVRTTEGLHRRWHAMTPKIGCDFCFPPPKPEPQPEPPVVEQTQEVVEVLIELPQPEIETVVEPEVEESPSTAMAAAFRNFKS
jgi:hypothetical protein